MIERKSRGSQGNDGIKSKTSHIKPSKYIDMVVSALQALKDHRGSIPKNVVGYIANTYDIKGDRKAISSSVYRALKQGIDDDLILKNSYGRYNLAAKAKRRKIPAKKRRKKRKGKKGGKRKKGKKRRKRRKKAKKKGKKKGKRRRRSKRKKSKKRRRRKDEDSEKLIRRKRSRKKDPDETK